MSRSDIPFSVHGRTAIGAIGWFMAGPLLLGLMASTMFPDETIVALRCQADVSLDTCLKRLFPETVSQPPLLLLLVGLPPTPSSLRVRIWRRLRSLGAVPLKRSAYLLPDTPERYEDFQWLAQEIQRQGGDATLIRVQQIENVSQDDVRRLFHEPRDLDYRQLAARYRKVLKKL